MADIELGYCTNVHAGNDLATTWANLRQHALGVKRRYSPERHMGIGLWLSARTARELREQSKVVEFAEWLEAEGLVPFTLNGFPYGDFHQEVVKKDVYLPTWWDVQRLDYTKQLIDLLNEILPPGREGSISTLPIAWGDPMAPDFQLEKAAALLTNAALHMHELEQRTGRLIYLCLEPEPGCVFTYAKDIVGFFQDFLLGGEEEAIVRRHLRVCHDVCHAAVMFEEQADVLRRYQEAGIEVGKIQVSAAVQMQLDDLAADERPAAIAQLRQFHEPRYLHQSVWRTTEDEEFFTDLAPALEAVEKHPQGELRTHFHVPIYLREFGRLATTQEEILTCLAAARETSACTHYEVETYAWNVLPADLQQPELAAGIAREMQWCAEALVRA
jgi:hypothetical protein